MHKRTRQIPTDVLGSCQSQFRTNHARLMHGETIMGERGDYQGSGSTRLDPIR